MTMTKKNKIAVIGAGYWGKNLIRNFNDLGHLGAICDQDSQLLRKYQKQYPKIDCYQSVSEILQAPEINSVAIATPAITHGKIALRALMNGKHTFVEKPLCLNIERKFLQKRISCLWSAIFYFIIQHFRLCLTWLEKINWVNYVTYIQLEQIWEK